MGLRTGLAGTAVTPAVRARVPCFVVDRIGVPLTIFAGSRLALVVLGYFAFILVPHAQRLDSSATLGSLVFDGWLRWDVADYLNVAVDGYWFDPVTRTMSANVLPLFPLLLRPFVDLGVAPAVAATIINIIAGAAALVLFHAFVAVRLGPVVAKRSCLLFCLLPYSFLYAVPLPWSLVLLFAVAVLLAEDFRHPWLAGGLAALAALTHPIGIAVWLAISVSRGSNIASVARKKGLLAVISRPSVILSLTIAPLVVAIFALYLHRDEGYPINIVVATVLGTPNGLLPRLADLPASYARDRLLLELSLGLVAVTLASLPRVARVFGVGAGAFTVFVVAFGLMGLPSIGPGLALAFPAVAIIGEVLRAELVETMVTGIFATVLGLFAVLFVTGYSIVPVSTHVFTPMQRAIATYHVRYHREHPEEVAPQDLGLIVDNSFLVLGGSRLSAHYSPGATVHLNYDLYVLQSTSKGYLISARLSDAQGKQVAQADKALWGHADSPLFASDRRIDLIAGNFVRESLSLILSPDLPPGAYHLDVLVFRIPTFERLSLATENGERVNELFGEDVVIAKPDEFGTEATVRVPHALHADLGGSLAFLGYNVQEFGSTENVSLYWAAKSVPEHDYTVFVQALDDSNKVVAQSDSFPDNGHFPTTRLKSGQVIRDVHVLAIPRGTHGRLRLIAGMYRVDTMQRLQVRIARTTSSSDHIDLESIDWAGS